MTTITVSSLPTVVTRQDLRLNIFIDTTTWEGLFDYLEVWRSRSGPNGPFEALTSDGWRPARLPLVLGDPPTIPLDGPSATIVGKTLSLRVNEEIYVEVLFTGSDPLTYGEAATQITAQSLRLARAFVLGGALVVETTQPGSAATLRVAGGTAAPLLGLPTQEPASVAFGTDARIPLVPAQTQYVFTDRNGNVEFFYKTRLFNSVAHTYSEFSLPFAGKSIPTLAPENLVRATVDLVDNQGVALANRAVLLAPRFTGARVAGKTLVDGRAQILTDENGHAEFMLVRGQSFTVAIAGTDLVRDITTPGDVAVQSFDVFDPAYGHDDLFAVQQPKIDFAVRRTL